MSTILYNYIFYIFISIYLLIFFNGIFGDFNRVAVDLDELLLVSRKEIRALNSGSNPIKLLKIANVHILNANAIAIHVSLVRLDSNRTHIKLP